MISVSRRIAFDVLMRVETAGAFAADLLHSACVGLESRDAGLAAEITMGCLRRQAQLDWLIARAAARPIGKMDPEVRVALRMGLYQLRHLDRVPAHAAVSESVELTRRAKKQSASGLVNALLRKAPRGEVAFPSDAIRLSMPEWLLDRWRARWGREVADAAAGAALITPKTYVRPDGRIQDIGSQWVIPLLDPRSGETFLDLCAAPGNKTAQAVELGVTAVACDRHVHRLRQMENLPCQRLALDATQPLPFSVRFDRILVDAPCSGTGTLARNPEIKWRLKPDDLADLHARQTAILRHALPHLAPRGRLVYSTCSLEAEENEDVVKEVMGSLPEHHYRLPGREEGDGFFAAIISGSEVS
ncbi:MAG: transcription antitermination factor NusB [Bryobacteraceae bacterium]|nr:transcription antitermination factor NusB [Bryobacteraceae bacterium]